MKQRYKSKTIVGTLVLAVALLKTITGVELLSNDEIAFLGGNVETVVTGLIALVSTITAIYGRVTAKEEINL